ncbi:hypothetical protein DPMN_103938 [Dreissena polymorpha]|uniref:Uncharacterized protein n=1 Tax=Dreissena polymorpha TaxID=45954 RepID=A0A9D4K2J5_DREPO|nr:hypothetical protein DPMN_103938 [Dreissena polymorpha]
MDTLSAFGSLTEMLFGENGNPEEIEGSVNRPSWRARKHREFPYYSRERTSCNVID